MRPARLRSFFGLGFIGDWPGAGTWASLVAIVPAWFLPQGPLLTLTVIFSLVGLLACRPVVDAFKAEDPQWFVWDEVCGMMLSVAWAMKTPACYAAAFVLFRVLDIWKPWPIRWFEKNTGAVGIMTDDLAAGAVTAAIIYSLSAHA